MPRNNQIFAAVWAAFFKKGVPRGLCRLAIVILLTVAGILHLLEVLVAAEYVAIGLALATIGEAIAYLLEQFTDHDDDPPNGATVIAEDGPEVPPSSNP